MTANEATVAQAKDHIVEQTDFGKLVWMVSGAQQNSDTMTIGRCHIAPGKANGRHYHPNCDEVLYLQQGRIRHSMGDTVVEMAAGDAVSIPVGVVHNAENIGAEEAICLISFSTPDRQAVGV